MICHSKTQDVLDGLIYTTEELELVRAFRGCSMRENDAIISFYQGTSLIVWVDKISCIANWMFPLITCYPYDLMLSVSTRLFPDCITHKLMLF